MKYFGVTWGTKAELEGCRLQSWYPPLPPSLSEGRRHFLQVKITSNYNYFCDLYFEFESSEYVLKIAKVFFLWCLQLPSQFPNKAVRALQWYCVGTVGTFNQKVEIKIWKFPYIDIYKLKIIVQKIWKPWCQFEITTRNRFWFQIFYNSISNLPYIWSLKWFVGTKVFT